MRELKRIKRILDKLEKLWNKSPDMRFGQLLINNHLARDDFQTWLKEDNEIEKILDTKLEEQ